MKNKSVATWITHVFVLIGALNWGLIGAFDFNVVEWALQGAGTFTNVVYIVIGFSAIYMIIIQGHLYDTKGSSRFGKK